MTGYMMVGCDNQITTLNNTSLCLHQPILVLMHPKVDDVTYAWQQLKERKFG
jgi:hypothetical protein